MSRDKRARLPKRHSQNVGRFMIECIQLPLFCNIWHMAAIGAGCSSCFPTLAVVAACSDSPNSPFLATTARDWKGLTVLERRLFAGPERPIDLNKKEQQLLSLGRKSNRIMQDVWQDQVHHVHHVRGGQTSLMTPHLRYMCLCQPRNLPRPHSLASSSDLQKLPHSGTGLAPSELVELGEGGGPLKELTQWFSGCPDSGDHEIQIPRATGATVYSVYAVAGRVHS